MKYFFFLLFILIIISCKKESRFDCFKSTGNRTTISRTTQTYNNIFINDIFNIELVQDSTNSIEITAGNNLLDLIETKITNDTLFISNNNKCNWARKYEDIDILIHTKNLISLIINGESTIISKDTLRYEYFSLDAWSHISFVDLIIDSKESHLNVHAGTGDFYFRGKSQLSYLYCHGNSRLYTNELISSYTSVLNNSTGNFYINAIDVIHAYIYSYGNVYYYGNPVIELIKTGEGNLIRIE